MVQAAPTTCPTDLEAYWKRLDDELAQYPAAPAADYNPLRSTAFAIAYDLRLTSISPYRIFGFLSVPKGSGPFPALLVTPRYGSVNNPPHDDDRRRYVVLTLMHRGQRLADRPFVAAYPGLLTNGIEDPNAYVYRGIIADCVRGAEFLHSLPEVDPDRIGITGDDLAMVTAARRPIFAALHLQTASLLFYRLMEARVRTSSYPIEEVNDLLRARPERASAVTRTVAYLDPLHHAPRVQASVLLPTGDSGALDGPDWLQPLADALGGQTEIYGVTHEGGTDHDWIDAWMARRLGVEPRPRVWRID
ncbi:MAG: acetylxylan esterase [Chloroflexota bacterium]|nr:acetylxylan esterase [Chloroflexota bacterium]